MLLAHQHSFAPRRSAMQAPSRRAVAPCALFGKKKAVVEAPPPAKKADSGFFGKKKVVVEAPPPAKKADSGFFGKKKAVVEAPPAKKAVKAAPLDKAAELKKRQGFFGGFMGAMDFAEVRSQSDAELLYDAKYGKLKDGKMSREQYNALRRKVGGTAKSFFKESVEVKGDYVDKGYVDESGTSVPALPFLALTVLALFGTVGYVVSQTAK